MLSGKEKAANFEAIHAAGGTTFDPSNPGIPIKTPDSVVLYNKSTGENRVIGSGAGAPATKPTDANIKTLRDHAKSPEHIAFFENLYGRGCAAKYIAGYADGGIPQRFRFSGEGGPREDKIPVKVAGENINVSNGEEALILPAKTASNPQAIEAIGQIIANSNDGRRPSMGQYDKPSFAAGGLIGGCRRRVA